MKSGYRLFLWAVLLLFGSPHVSAQFVKRPWPSNVSVPSMEFTDLSGRSWNWPQLKGKVVVINFWATWCAPCIEELPSLQRLQELNQNKPLMVLTINHKEGPRKIRQFNAENGFTLPVVADRQGDISKQWGIKIFPTTVLFSKEGQPLWIIEGSADWNSKEIDQWLN